MVKEKKDRRIRKTENQLRAGLAKLKKEKNIREITVKELVEEVDINRSTFYLHYTDIYNMMSTIEEELMEDFRQVIADHPEVDLECENAAYVKEIFSVLEKNREICQALMGEHGGSFVMNQSTFDTGIGRLGRLDAHSFHEPVQSMRITFSVPL